MVLTWHAALSFDGGLAGTTSLQPSGTGSRSRRRIVGMARSVRRRWRWRFRFNRLLSRQTLQRSLVFRKRHGRYIADEMPVFRPARLLSKTVHYVMPSYMGTSMRVLSPGTEYLDFTRTGTSNKVSLPIDPKFHKPLGTQTKGPKVRHNQWRYVDYDGDHVLDLIVGIEDWSYYGWDDAWNKSGEWQNGPLRGWIYVFRNQGTDTKPSYAEPFFVEANEERLEVFGCPSPNFADFDGDGDLDLICGEFLDKLTYFENIGSRIKPKYSQGKRVVDASGDAIHMTVQMIVPVAFDWDRDGDTDLIVGDEDGRVALVENSGTIANRCPVFAAPKYFQQQADTLKCGALATPYGFDWDGDGDTDILCGNTAGFIEFFENLSGPKVAQPKWNKPVRLSVDGKEFRILAGPTVASKALPRPSGVTRL